MTKADLSEVMKIEQESFNSPWSESAFIHELEANFLATYFVFEHLIDETEKVIFGYGGYWLIKGDAHITNLAVKPEYRGKGAGKLVVKTLLEHAKYRGATRATLEVRKSNEKAKQLYHLLGFKILGIRPNYYQDNQEDAVIMWKQIRE